MRHSLATRTAFLAYGVVCLLFLYLPLLATGFASFASSPYLSYPLRDVTIKWYVNALSSPTVANIVSVSLKVAFVVTAISVAVGFFAALAFARYRWRFRKKFQKFVLLPIFFPQPVLGLAVLMLFTSLGVQPSWKTAIVAHLVWIMPITTIIIAIRAYSIDPLLEEAARDMGATTRQTLFHITLPLLSPGLVTGGLFAFLLSWSNFALSVYTTGADTSLPEWLYAKMVNGYVPLVPVVGMLSIAGSAALIIIAMVLWGLVRRRRSMSRSKTNSGNEIPTKETRSAKLRRTNNA